jgi:hypothetical protein
MVIAGRIKSTRRTGFPARDDPKASDGPARSLRPGAETRHKAAADPARPASPLTEVLQISVTAAFQLTNDGKSVH